MPDPDPTALKRTLYTAAAFFGAGLIAAAIVLVVGFAWVVDRGMGRFESAVNEHARAVNAAGTTIGQAGQQGLNGLSNEVRGHTSAVAQAGERISRPLIRMPDPIDLKQPVKVEGPHEDGSLPVRATVGK